MLKYKTDNYKEDIQSRWKRRTPSNPLACPRN